MQRRTFTLGAVSTTVGVCAPAIVRAEYYEAELCLMLDCSPSMFRRAKNYALQREGHYLALLNQEVQAALLKWQPLISVYAWSDKPELLVERPVRNTADLETLAQELFDRAPTYKTGDATQHEKVLKYFRKQSPKGVRRVIDISTDEAPYHYKQDACRRLSDELYLDGTQVNLLSIDARGTISDDLEKYVKTPNGFVKRIEEFSQYKEGIRQKLQRDLAV